MFKHSVVDWGGRIVKLVLLAAIVVLGIVFIPDDFVARLQRDFASARDGIQREVLTRLPAIGRELDVKYSAAKTEVVGFYQAATKKFSETVGSWVWGKINGEPR